MQDGLGSNEMEKQFGCWELLLGSLDPLLLMHILNKNVMLEHLQINNTISPK